MSHMQTMAHNDALYESDHPIPARSSADLAVSNPYTRQDQDPQTYALREAHALPTPSGPHSAFEAYVEGPGGVSLPSHRAYGPATTARNGTPPVAEQEGSPAPRRKSKLERSLEPSGYAAADTEGVQLDYADPTKTIRPHRGSPAGARAKVGPSRTSGDSTAGDAPSHLGRSGTEFLSRYNERNEAVLGSPRNGDGILHDLEAGVANRTAAALQEAKDRGLATPAMIEHATAAPGVNPYAVSDLSIQIQRGFRRKMLTILLVQLLYSIGLGLIIRYTPVGGIRPDVPLEQSWLATAFPAQSWSALLLMVCTLVGIPCLSCVKDKHPWNLIATWLWSTLLAVFLAAADIPDAYARAHSMFIIMTMLAFGVFLLLLLTQLPGLKTPEGNPGLLSFGVAGLISWVTWLSTAIALKATVPLFMTEEFDTGPFVSSCVVSSIVFAWFCYEAFKLSAKMSPDEYMKGVIYFYTDMFYVCMCCALLACLGSAGGGSGAPETEEEAPER